MNENIIVADILRGKQKGFQMYSSAFGNIFLENVYEDGKIRIYSCDKDGNEDWAETINPNGSLVEDGECIIFPSKEMRDWNKFSWKKGDVLISNDGKREVFFCTWVNDSYTKFASPHCLITNDNEEVIYDKGTTVFNTNDFKSIEVDDAARTYINTIEERLGGKLNRETLEIEKNQPKFEDGDIVSLEIRYIDSEDVIVETYIVHGAYNCGKMNFYAGWSDNTIDKVVYNSFIRPENSSIRKEQLRYATKEEKQQLFEALAKEGKAWDSEKKAIVDLKPKWTPKPFDRVITRNAADDIWAANIFSHMDSHGEYVTIGCVGGYTYCLPYNEETAKLIGTTDNWEG